MAHLPAVGAASIEEELVAGHSKASRQLRLELDTTPFHLKDFAAGVAVEVVMVFLARYLVTRRFTRELNTYQPLVIDQVSNVAVDRRDADSFHLLLRIGEGFLWREWPVRIQERRSNSLLLSGIP